MRKALVTALMVVTAMLAVTTEYYEDGSYKNHLTGHNGCVAGQYCDEPDAPSK